MHILIVHAHENPDSFCSTLAHLAKKTFEEAGHTTDISDLYAMGFNPVGSIHDFTKTSNNDYYKYATEQLYASENDAYVHTLQQEMDKLILADILIFNFPLWWWSMPAILKGWVDRVLAYGVAYGGSYGFNEQGRFKGKRAFICTTTGSPKLAYTSDGHNDKSIHAILDNIHSGIFELIGFTVTEPFIAYGVSRISQEERAAILIDYKQFLSQL